MLDFSEEGKLKYTNQRKGINIVKIKKGRGFGKKKC
jgi:hypothetical protein